MDTSTGPGRGPGPPVDGHRGAEQDLVDPPAPWDFGDTERWLLGNPGFARLIDRLPMALVQLEMRADGWVNIYYISRYCEQLMNLDRRSMMENGPDLSRVRLHPEDLPWHEERMRAAARDGLTIDHDFRFRRGPDDEIWLHLHLVPEQVGDNQLFHGYVHDVTERKTQALLIHELAHRDSLTGLANRRSFVQDLAAAIDRHRLGNTFGGLLFLDLDNFKQLNDSQGHSVGDAYLVETGRRINAVTGSADRSARIGGDEFAVILDSSAADQTEAARTVLARAEQLLSSLREGFELGELRHTASASIGAVVLDGTQTPEEFLRRADIAMYQVKHHGKNSVALFETANGDALKDRYLLAMDFRDAAVGSGLLLHLQPQIDSQGRIYGAEALARWNHPTRGLLQPTDFIDTATEFGLWTRTQLDLLADGISTLRDWSQTPGLSRLTLAVNVDASTFLRDEFVPQISHLVESAGIDPSRLTLELTESVFARDHQRLATHMSRLHQLGVRMSLDDFGSGYSSLGYLADLPFQEVKIDGQFVRELPGSDRHLSIVRAIIALAGSLGLDTVAEYVETEVQRDLLHSLGCRTQQGFLHGAPMALKTFEQLVLAG